MKNFELKKFSNDLELATAAASEWLDLLSREKSDAPHLVAFSVGRIAKTLCAQITSQAKAQNISLARVHFFWVDERCVPPTSPDSNFLLANEGLFQPLHVAPDKIHRLKGELDPKAAVADANTEIARFAPKNTAGMPVLDLVFLGLGEDGHTASLFPNATPEIINCREAYLHVNNSPKPPPQRLTLSFAAMAAAKEAWMLASGNGKEHAFKNSLADGEQTPFGRVLSIRQTTKIYSALKF